MVVDAQRWDRQYAEHDPPSFEDPSRRVAEEILHLPPGRALDLAGGRGRHAIPLAERGWDVTAVDFSQQALRQGGQLAAQRGVTVGWVHADLESWDPPGLAFDLVLIAYLQVDTAVLAAVLSRAAGAVAPGGRLVAVGYGQDASEPTQAGPRDPSRRYDLAVATAAVGPLVVERAELVERTIERAEGNRVAVEAVVRAVRPAVSP